MRKLQVTYLPSGTTAHVPEGTSLFNAAHWAGLPIESTCGGRGTCGKCKVRVLEGPAEPTPADHRLLGSAEIDAGWRLSCQSLVVHDTCAEVPRLMRTPKAATMGVGRFVLLEPNVQKLVLDLTTPSLDDARSHARRLQDALREEGLEVEVPAPVLRTLAEILGEGEHRLTATVVGDHLVDVEPGDTSARIFGVAVDIGTTTVVATLVDLVTGAALGVASTINGQAHYGADVIARMGHAMQGGGEAIQRLRDAVVETVNGLLDEVCAQAGIGRNEVFEAVLVGNATMLHLFLGVEPRSIALAPFVATFLEALTSPRRRPFCRSILAVAWRYSPRSARTSAPTSWGT